MTTRHAARLTVRIGHHAAAFVLALASTLVIFSGVDRLATPAQPGAVLVQVSPAAPQA